jgi:chromosome segregation ATPase
METPIKTWSTLARKSFQKTEKITITMAIFQCPKCKTTFKAILPAETKSEKTTSIINSVDRIKSIKQELTHTLENLHEKIQLLETDRAHLMIEIEKLKKVAELRAGALQSEISSLREEITSLKGILEQNHEPEK